MLEFYSQHTEGGIYQDRKLTLLPISHITGFYGWLCFLMQGQLTDLSVKTLFTKTTTNCETIGVFTNSPQYNNANIANFILVVPLEKNWTNEVCKLKM